MKWHFGILFLFVLYLDEIVSQNSLKSQLDRPDSKIIKRDVFEELKRKINKDNTRKNLKLWTTESPIKKLNMKNLSNFQSKIRSAGKLPSHKHAEMYKDLQNRVQELKMRMSAGKHHPQFKSRTNFEDKLDVKEYYRKAVEELQEKYKHHKPDLYKKALQNRIDIGSSKLGSVNKKNKEAISSTTTTTTSTTEKSKGGRIPVVVLMPSSTTTKPQEEMDAKKTDTVLERLKEKQKEAVTKIKDKFSFSKNNEDESEKKQ